MPHSCPKGECPFLDVSAEGDSSEDEGEDLESVMADFVEALRYVAEDFLADSRPFAAALRAATPFTIGNLTWSFSTTTRS